MIEILSIILGAFLGVFLLGVIIPAFLLYFNDGVPLSELPQALKELFD